MTVVERTTGAATTGGNVRRAVRIGLWIAAIDVAVRMVGGNFANEWEGWGVSAAFMTTALVEGIIAVILVFGLLVRIGMRPSSRGNRPAKASLLAGVLGILSYVLFFTGLPAVVGAGAMALGIEGLRRRVETSAGRGSAIAGIVLAVINLGFTAIFYVYEIVVGITRHWI